jgi:hypothetical protein
MVESSHRRAQWIVSLALGINRLLCKHSAIEPITIPTAHPLVSHGGGKPHPIPKLRGVERNTAKLGGKCSLGSFKMNFLILIV